jgi:C1A family cysteine protease
MRSFVAIAILGAASATVEQAFFDHIA